MPIGGKKYGQKGGGGRGLSLENRSGGGLGGSILVNFGGFSSFFGVFPGFSSFLVISRWISGGISVIFWGFFDIFPLGEG